MSQDPLRSMRRRVARPQREFPEEIYRELALEPLDHWAIEEFADYARDVWLAHAIVLVQARSIGPVDGCAAVGALLAGGVPDDDAADHRHALAAIEARALAVAGGVLRLGTSAEEVFAAVTRMSARARLLDAYDRVVELREAFGLLAGQHLNTLTVITSNGQSVQPTSLAHYLAARAAPLVRVCQRVGQAYERLNLSPIGAVSGASSAVPLDRKLGADLLGFDGVIENTLDSLIATDWLDEVASIIASAGTTLSGFVADLRQWSRDDVGTLVPGEGQVHRGTGQPQRVDPLVLDHLHVRVTTLTSLPGRLAQLLGSQQMLAGEASRLGAAKVLLDGLEELDNAVRLVTSILAHLDVNRSLFATRTNRGFSTSSELAELLATDFKLPANEAFEIAERVVIEALQAALDATTLRTDLVDRVALQVIGREVGIEPELLSRCLAPKRFIERRDVLGGPAPAAVSAQLDREVFAIRLDRDWAASARSRIGTAREALQSRARDVAGVSTATEAE